MRKIAYYARVSTKGQEEKDTIENQIQEMNRVYEKEKIIEIYKDTFTGASLNRPALNQLREDIKKELFDVLVVYDSSRLAREPVVLYMLIEEFRENGIELKFLYENFDDTPEGELHTGIKAHIDKYERLRIIRRTTAGRKRKLGNGNFVGGYASLGYTYHKKTDDREGYYEINPEEARVVKLIFDMFEREQSIAGTTNLLNKMGCTRRSPTLKKTNGFYKTSVRNILKNESYAGSYWYGKTHMEEGKLFKNVINGETRKRLKNDNESEWIRLDMPIIIDSLQFNRVQKILKERRVNFFRPTKYFYLCAGLIKCIHCGRRYTARHIKSKKIRKGSEYKYEYSVYYCPQRDKNHQNPTMPKCKSRQISANKIDDYVWDYLVNLIREPERIKNAIRLITEKRNSKKDNNKKILTSLKLKKEQVKLKKEKLLDLYVDSGISKRELSKKMEALSEEEDLLENRINQLDQELLEIDNAYDIEKEIEILCLKFSNKLDKLTPEDKKAIARKWIKEISITDKGSIKVVIKLPSLKFQVQESSPKVEYKPNPSLTPALA